MIYKPLQQTKIMMEIIAIGPRVHDKVYALAAKTLRFFAAKCMIVTTPAALTKIFKLVRERRKCVLSNDFAISDGL